MQPGHAGAVRTHTARTGWSIRLGRFAYTFEGIHRAPMTREIVGPRFQPIDEGLGSSSARPRPRRTRALRSARGEGTTCLTGSKLGSPPTCIGGFASACPSGVGRRGPTPDSTSRTGMAAAPEPQCQSDRPVRPSVMDSTCGSSSVASPRGLPDGSRESKQLGGRLAGAPAPRPRQRGGCPAPGEKVVGLCLHDLRVARHPRGSEWLEREPLAFQLAAPLRRCAPPTPRGARFEQEASDTGLRRATTRSLLPTSACRERTLRPATRGWPALPNGSPRRVNSRGTPSHHPLSSVQPEATRGARIVPRL